MLHDESARVSVHSQFITLLVSVAVGTSLGKILTYENVKDITKSFPADYAKTVPLLLIVITLFIVIEYWRVLHHAHPERTPLALYADLLVFAPAILALDAYSKSIRFSTTATTTEDFFERANLGDGPAAHVPRVRLRPIRGHGDVLEDTKLGTAETSVLCARRRDPLVHRRDLRVLRRYGPFGFPSGGGGHRRCGHLLLCRDTSRQRYGLEPLARPRQDLDYRCDRVHRGIPHGPAAPREQASDSPRSSR